MNEINRDIKSGQLKNVYLLYGEEDYLKRQNLKKLTEAFGVDEKDMNFSRFEGDDLNSAEIAGTISTMPFLSDKRVVVIKNSGFCASGDENLKDAVSKLPETSYVVFCEKDVRKNTALYKAIAAKGTVEECVMPPENTLMTWIVGRAKNAGKRMTTGAWNAFAKATYANKKTRSMEYMNNEIEKLISYTWDRDEITEADVLAICSPQYLDHIFDMVNAIGSRDKEKVMRLYNELLVAKVSAGNILGLICRQFRILLVLHDYADENMRPEECAHRLGLQAFEVQKYFRFGMLKKFPPEKVKALLNDALSTQQKIRSGQMNEKIGVELFIMEYCR